MEKSNENLQTVTVSGSNLKPISQTMVLKSSETIRQQPTVELKQEHQLFYSKPVFKSNKYDVLL